MELNEYQERAKETAIYRENPNFRIIYPALGLAGETGEVVEKVKKWVRDAKLDHDAIKKEIGDVMWYIAALCSDLGITMEDVAQTNLDKLASRKARGVLHGSGDNR